MVMIRFTVSPTQAGRVHFVTEADIRIVLSRLPEELYSRLRSVHLNDRGMARTLGYVNRGRREIALCALPRRVSLGRAMLNGQNPRRFGGNRNGPWPSVAVRRFMLYQVFLHELGHLQIVNENSRSVRRKFAMETKAQDFAELWCSRLLSEPLDHPDPAHCKPTSEEFKDPNPELSDLQRRTKQFPSNAALFQELGKLCSKLKQRESAKTAFEQSLALNPRDAWTLMYLGNCHLQDRDYPNAAQLFLRATELLPDRSIGYWLLGQVHERLGDWESAESHYLRAVEVEPTDKSAKERLKQFRLRQARNLPPLLK